MKYSALKGHAFFRGMLPSKTIEDRNAVLEHTMHIEEDECIFLGRVSALTRRALLQENSANIGLQAK